MDNTDFFLIYPTWSWFLLSAFKGNFCPRRDSRLWQNKETLLLSNGNSPATKIPPCVVSLPVTEWVRQTQDPLQVLKRWHLKAQTGLSLGTTNFAPWTRFTAALRALLVPLCCPSQRCEQDVSHKPAEWIKQMWDMHSTQSLALAINSKNVSTRITKNSWETLLYLQISFLQFLLPCCSRKKLPLRISAGSCVSVIEKTYRGIYFSVKCILLQSKFQVWKTCFLKGGAVTKSRTTEKEILTRAHMLLPHHEPLSSLQSHWSNKTPHRTWPSAKRNSFLAISATVYPDFKIQQHWSETGTRGDFLKIFTIRITSFIKPHYCCLLMHQEGHKHHFNPLILVRDQKTSLIIRVSPVKACFQHSLQR